MDVQAFSPFDYFILIVLAFSVITGVLNGFFKEILSLLKWVLSIWVAHAYYHVVANMLLGGIHSSGARVLVAFIGLLIVGLVCFSFIGRLIRRAVSPGAPSVFGRILGFGVGVVYGVFWVSIFVLLLQVVIAFGLMPLSVWSTSALVPHVRPLSDQVKNFLPGEFDQALTQQFQQRASGGAQGGESASAVLGGLSKTLEQSLGGGVQGGHVAAPSTVAQAPAMSESAGASSVPVPQSVPGTAPTTLGPAPVPAAPAVPAPAAPAATPVPQSVPIPQSVTPQSQPTTPPS